MPNRIRRQPRAPRDGFDHVRLDFNGGGSCRPCGKLRIEGPGNAIGALRGECRGGIKEAEVARVGHMHDAVLHLRDAPREELIERARSAKIKRRELTLEGGKIERRHDRSLGNACIHAWQFARQKVIQSLALRARRKERRRPAR